MPARLCAGVSLANQIPERKCDATFQVAIDPEKLNLKTL